MPRDPDALAEAVLDILEAPLRRMAERIAILEAIHSEERIAILEARTAPVQAAGSDDDSNVVAMARAS